MRRLAEAQVELESVMKNLKEKQQTLTSVEEKIAALQKSFDDSVAEKEQLEKNMALTQARLKRAGKLTTALADEKTRWEETVAVSTGPSHHHHYHPRVSERRKSRRTSGPL